MASIDESPTFDSDQSAPAGKSEDVEAPIFTEEKHDKVDSATQALKDATHYAEDKTKEKFEKRKEKLKEKKGLVKDIMNVSTTTTVVTEQQVERIRETHKRMSDLAERTWDYAAFLNIASLVAAFGLAGNSSTSVIASMLLSPLMNPVLGMSYGLFISDYRLMWRSMYREVESIGVCVVVGIGVSAVISFGMLAEDWPTSEMSSRGELGNLLLGFPVAFFSGLGVALAFGDESMSSLVGVAISASLLPPAVNAGLMWMHAIYIATGHVAPNEPAYDYFHAGGMSLALTVVNVVMVWIAAMLMFRIKEVLPIEKSDFWHDLKTARRIMTRRATLGIEEAAEGLVGTPLAEL